jgi:hypothetical protein
VVGQAIGKVSHCVQRAAGRVSGPPSGGESDRDGSRDRANARGVDDKRVGKRDHGARARRSRPAAAKECSIGPVVWKSSVRGFAWESLLLGGKEGRPQVVAMTWWGREKGVEGQQRQQQERRLSRAARQWGGKVRHVAGSRVRHRSLALSALPLPRALCGAALQKGNKLLDDAGGERKAWEIARGQRSWGTEAKLLWDTHVRVYRCTRVLALPVRHPEYQGCLWLVVVREAQRTRTVVFAHQ